MGLFPGAIAAFRGQQAHGLEGPFFSVKEMLPVSTLEVLVLVNENTGLSFKGA